MDPVGDINVAATGGPEEPWTVNDIGVLQELIPTEFFACTHHCPAPAFSVVVGVKEQLPDPAPHPAAAAVYHC
jgi:hypothetical protein